VAGVTASRPCVLDSVGVVVVVRGVVRRWQGWPYGADSDGVVLPPAWRHGLTLCSHEKGVRGCRWRETCVAQRSSQRRLVPVRPNNAGTSPQRAAWCCSDGDGHAGLTATGMPDPAGPTLR
jgi:hypothetical protein